MDGRGNGLNPRGSVTFISRSLVAGQEGEERSLPTVFYILLGDYVGFASVS